ncbi:hypothetical protein [Arthrobacter sp. Br18]|uniref:hypothetical protein n=1 Tax=Arthrobacter sp. Br18 TaxID=1312954 RepID=UPI0004BC7C1C|nr:hypothetical protein [Arthrobacter sp. Br18]
MSAGHTRITTQALTSTARAVAAETLRVPAADVRASFSDEAGLLALHLGLPLSIPPLASVAADPSLVEAFGGSLAHRAQSAQALILERIQQLTGARLSRVDLRVTGLSVARERRVR